jgi:hypothetical protein
MKAELDIMSEQKENLSKQVILFQTENTKLNEELNEAKQNVGSDATALLGVCFVVCLFVLCVVCGCLIFFFVF